MANPSDHYRFVTSRKDQDESVSALIAENIALQRELLDQIKALKPRNGNGNGNGAKLVDGMWRILIALAIAIAIGAHGLLWFLDKTVAVQEGTIQATNGRVERNESDIHEIENELRQHVRDHNGSKR